MSQWQIAQGLSEDRTLIAIEIQEDGQTRAGIVYDRPELEDLIHNLANSRAEMSEQVPEDIDPGTRKEAQLNPRWKVRSDVWDRGPVLLLRHSGLGWLSFAIPQDQADEIAKCLLDPDHPRQR
jgi:hypothetical protein